MAKTQRQLEDEADKGRKAGVDAANKKAAKASAEAEAKAAKDPLTQEEKQFVAQIGAKMNIGRQQDMPAPADILRYSKLLKRQNVT